MLPTAGKLHTECVIDPRVKGVLRRSLEAAAAENGLGGLLNLQDDGTMWAGTGFGSLPWFFIDESGKIQSRQLPIFGIYLVRAALRSVFINARAIAAGDLLAEKQFGAASSIMYYTGAFHGLDGLLAARGRVIFQPVRGPMRAERRSYPGGGEGVLLTHDPLPKNPEALCAILSRKGNWSFEPRGRSHIQRWSELKQLLSSRNSTLPQYVLKALKYAIGPYEDVTDPHELLERGLIELTHLRHQALYEGFGYDDIAFDMVVNGESSGRGLELRSRALRALADGFLEDALDVADFFFDWERAAGSKAKGFSSRLKVSVLVPSFEAETTDLTAHPQNDRIGRVRSWMLSSGASDQSAP